MSISEDDAVDSSVLTCSHLELVMTLAIESPNGLVVSSLKPLRKKIETRGGGSPRTTSPRIFCILSAVAGSMARGFANSRERVMRAIRTSPATTLNPSRNRLSVLAPSCSSRRFQNRTTEAIHRSHAIAPRPLATELLSPKRRKDPRAKRSDAITTNISVQSSLQNPVAHEGRTKTLVVFATRAVYVPRAALAPLTSRPSGSPLEFNGAVTRLSEDRNIIGVVGLGRRRGRRAGAER